MFLVALVWATLGTGNLPRVQLPPGVRRVVLCGDNDDAGRSAVDAAIVAYGAIGREVAAIFPKAGKDFNAEWMMLHV